MNKNLSMPGTGAPSIAKMKIEFASAFTSIDQYEVMYSANTFVPRIWLKSGGNYIGQLIFEPDGKGLPSDSQQNDQVNLHYHLEDFENVIALLSSNQHVSLLYNGSGGGYENGIYAGTKNVGT
jgi:hypothetical protein